MAKVNNPRLRFRPLRLQRDEWPDLMMHVIPGPRPYVWIGRDAGFASPDGFIASIEPRTVMALNRQMQMALANRRVRVRRGR